MARASDHTFVNMTIEEAREMVAIATALADARALLTQVARDHFGTFDLAARMVEKADRL